MAVNPAHYDLPIQPIDYISANQLDFFRGNVIKYLSRSVLEKDVNKVIESIEKSIVYCAWLLEQELVLAFDPEVTFTPSPFTVDFAESLINKIRGDVKDRFDPLTENKIDRVLGTA